MHEPEEVFDVVFPSGDEAAELVHPGEQSFHLPEPSVAAHLAAILRFASAQVVGGDHVDAVFLGKLLIEGV
jgi:hypothetical protein